MTIGGRTLGLAMAVAMAWGCTKNTDDDSPDSANDGATTSDEAPATGTTTSGGEPPATSTSPGSGGPVATGTDDGASDDEDDPPPPIKLDVGGVSDIGELPCVAPPPVNCDHLDDDPWHAIGLNCPGGPSVDESVDLTGPAQIAVHSGNLGTHVPAPYPPQEGQKFVILSSGDAADLAIPGLFASTGIGFGGSPLPPPLVTNPVSATDDCVDDPGLVGTGDCSNTIQVQWDQGNGSAYDYAEMRFTVDVPLGTPGFTYDFAMFSTEYPDFYQTQYNDMYIAWLESENWTGNISFDDMGNPISLNAGFLDYKDAPNPYDCPAPCDAPELAGTAMEGHAGTRWLTTTAGVVPGESIEVVFAVFDLSDSILDTVIILDNFQWACAGGPPVTIPG